MSCNRCTYSVYRPQKACPVHLRLAGLFICVLFVQSKAQHQVKTSEEKVVYAQYFNIIKVFAALVQKDSSTVC